MYVLCSGMLCALFLIASALFLRSYKCTRDRLLAIFAVAFVILALNSFYAGVIDKPEVDNPFAHLPQLVAFALILGAVIDKNRAARGRRVMLRVVGRPRTADTPPRPAEREPEEQKTG